MYQQLNKVSTESVKKATGKTWDQWVRLLNKEGARQLSHKDILALLKRKKLVTTAWWQQMVSTGYEQAIKRHLIGEAKSAGFEIRTAKTFNISPQKAWRLLTTPPGLTVWLGEVKTLKMKSGAAYETDKAKGEIRAIVPGERLRLTWQSRKHSEPTIIQVTIAPRQANKGTCIRFHQESLSNATEREQMRKHWQEVLEKLEALS